MATLSNNVTGDGEPAIKGTSKKYTGIWGESAGGGSGVYGKSSIWHGVFGESDSNTGVLGTSNSGFGVHGASKSTTAVLGQSEQGYGVHGDSGGVNGVGVFGSNQKGGWAAIFDGRVEVRTTLTVVGDIMLPNADCAEDFDVLEAVDLEPGMTMVVGDGGILQPSEHEYDRRVAGIVSGAGNFRPGLVLDRTLASPTRWPIALIGKVYCKVDASAHPVEVGDLLTTSSTFGHAMKVTDPSRAFGAVIGKALGTLTSGKGLVPVLVALQ